MIPIGFLMAWVGYGLAFYGHSLVKGYNLSLAQVISPVGYYKGKWPPPIAINMVIFPNGKAADNGPSGSGSGSGGGSTAVANVQSRVNRVDPNQQRQGPIPSRF